MSNLKTKLLVEVNIEDVENKYPNFKFNYTDKKDFLINNIIAGFERVTDEQEYDAGYETVVANTMLDCMGSFLSVGDRVAYIENNKPIFGIVKDITWKNDKGYCQIIPSNSNIQNTIVLVETTYVITIYDFLKEI